MGEGPHTSLCTSWSKLNEEEWDMGSEISFVFAQRQLVHALVEIDLFEVTLKRHRRLCNTFGEGWPNC